MEVPSTPCTSGFLVSSRVRSDDGVDVVVAGGEAAGAARPPGVARGPGRSRPNRSSTRLGRASAAAAPCRTASRDWRRSCDGRWGSADARRRCAAVATRSSCRPKPSTCTTVRAARRRRTGQAAADGDLSRAVALLAEADALWRGDPLADFTYEDFAATTITRLSELRLAVIEERLDLELQLGRHQGAIVQLEAMVAAHALRERLRGLLMLALYRAGRQADALRVFQEGRRILGDELGLEPSHELRQLETAILAQDRYLDAPQVDGKWRSDRRLRRASFEDPRSVDAAGRARRRAARADAAAGPASFRDARRAGRRRQDAARVGGGASRSRRDCAVRRSSWSELAPVGDPAGVRAAIAAARELPEPSRLAELITDQELLIVLDNCEHVIATAAEVAEDLFASLSGLAHPRHQP